MVQLLATKLPESTLLWKLHHASFLVGKKVFAFTRPNGVVLKLPQAKIADVLGTRDASLLVMGKRTMREWVLVRDIGADPEDKDLELFRDAMAFVART